MLRIDGRVCWSPSDLAESARCEYAVLRRLDLVLGRVAAVATGDDARRRRVAAVGARHEASILAAMRSAGAVVSLPRAAPPPTAAGLRAAQAATLRALAGGAGVVHGARLFDGEMLGRADFLRRTPRGWEVCDAALARQARPEALLRLGAWADLAARAGVPVAPEVALLVGGGTSERFPLAEVLAVSAARRQRLRRLVAEHGAEAGAMSWGDERYVACGWCAECQAAVLEHRDLLLVARMRLDQRRRLHEVGVRTVDDLARATDRPEYMTDATFERLRAQAALQRRYLGTGVIGYELTADAPAALAALPPACEGDLFFDFEGDPLHREGDRWGLEYLWGVLDGHGYQARWAHDAVQERAALAWFLDLLEQRRAEHPDLHVYHYAGYETAALKRLVARHQVGEDRLDDLLRGGVFVDLYAVVRGAVRAATPSYSLKRLEPLFLAPGERRAGEVQSGEASVVEYHDYRALRDDGDTAAAERRLAALAAYNADDCLATLRLRDWLLRLAGEARVRARPRPPAPAAPAAVRPPDQDALLRSLAARAGTPGHRTADEQAYALLAAALGYFRREARPYWWAHFDRLSSRVDDWSETRDVFRVEAAEVLADWSISDGAGPDGPGEAARVRRVLRLTGRWGPGSTPGGDALVVYEPPLPPGVRTAEGGLLGWRPARSVECSDDDDGAVVVTESCAAEEAAPALPAALAPAPPPHPGRIERAVREVASRAAGPDGLPAQPAVDLLRRRAPRVPLPRSGDPAADVTAALLALEDSFVAVQGPPGSGKTRTGARVVAGLVAAHGWRVGVVAQSHAAVEAMLDAVVAAGLDPARVGKAEARHGARPRWRVLGGVAGRAAFLAEHDGAGCVLGGTAWTFSADRLVRPGGLDLLVVDEAGQLALPPTIGASRSARRLLLLGDPQQLPQVSQGTHAEPVDRSALGWLLAGHATMPAELGYFLEHTHRMHPALCDKVSTLAYDGRLSAAPAAASRLLEGVEPGLRVVRVEHRDNRTSSPEEADEVVAQVSGLLGTPWHDPADRVSPRPLEQADLRVVAPYNAQVRLVRRRLREAGFADVPVGTVDRFQGQEAPVVLVTMTASSHGDVPRGMRFLLNRNRVNVAVSRAQWLAVLVCSDRLTAYLPSSAEGLVELGAFLRLTGGAAADP